jgi:nucleotide-binding universal stress UspA family protein
MYRKILLAYDGSVEGRRALREGAMLARLCGAEVVLLAVVNLSAGIMMAEGAAPGAIEHQREAYAQILAEGVERLRALGFAPESRLEFGSPAREITATAKRCGADLVVVRRQSSFARWWGDSVGSSLLEDLSCSLLIAQNEPNEAEPAEG